MASIKGAIYLRRWFSRHRKSRGYTSSSPEKIKVPSWFNIQQFLLLRETSFLPFVNGHWLKNVSSLLEEECLLGWAVLELSSHFVVAVWKLVSKIRLLLPQTFDSRQYGNKHCWTLLSVTELKYLFLFEYFKTFLSMVYFPTHFFNCFYFNCSLKLFQFLP